MGIPDRAEHLNGCSKLHRHNVYRKSYKTIIYYNIGGGVCSKSEVEVVIRAPATCMLHEEVFDICDMALPS